MRPPRQSASRWKGSSRPSFPTPKNPSPRPARRRCATCAASRPMRQVPSCSGSPAPLPTARPSRPRAMLRRRDSSMFEAPETWVAIAFVLLMGLFAWFGIHRTVLKALDNRSGRIKAELDDARRLKDEAAKVLAEYKARRASAEKEAADIVASA